MKHRFFRSMTILLLLILAFCCWCLAAETESGPEAALIDSNGEVLQTYATLWEALEKVTSGTIRLERDATLTSNSGSGMEYIFLKPDVTLVIPCVDQDPGYVQHGNLMFNHDNMDPNAKGSGACGTRYRTLTIPSNVILIARGTVLVNSVSGRPYGGNNEMDVTGGYGEIQLEGQMMLASEGALDCFGYVRGDGQVTATNGSTVGDLFVVRNWRGGTVGLAMFEEMIYPMNESDCRNIEADLKIEAGAKLEGLVKMYAGNSYNYTRFPQIDGKNGLIRLEEDAYVLRSFDVEKEREIYRISGGAQFSHSKLTIVGIPLTSADFLYPIDGDMEFLLEKGAYQFVNDFKFLPGSSMTVKGDATLRVKQKADGETEVKEDVDVDDSTAPDVEGVEKPDTVVNNARDGLVTVVFYDQFVDKQNDGTQYPSGRAAAFLKLETGAKLYNEGIFAGTVRTEEENVFGEMVGTLPPKWQVNTRETIGVNSHSFPVGQRHQELSFGLNIVKDQTICVVDERDGSLAWGQFIEGDPVAIAGDVSETTDGILVEATIIKPEGNSLTCKVLAALYDENWKLLQAVANQNVCNLSGNGQVIVPLQFQKSEAAVNAKIFVVGAEAVDPVARELKLSVQ